jgi:hypothetical protein
VRKVDVDININIWNRIRTPLRRGIDVIPGRSIVISRNEGAYVIRMQIQGSIMRCYIRYHV